VTTELIRRARAGDSHAFAELVDPYRGGLQAHCYRMLGSLQDSEDLLQETLLAAWLGFEGFESRSSVRTWLYRIATNKCLNQLRSTKRRPAPPAALSATVPEPTQLGEVFWLQPYPDAIQESFSDEAAGPEARYEAREAISLAFVTAVQLLPPNQRAVLLLSDVLGFRAAEIAELLSLTASAVTSALKRARSTMAAAKTDRPAPPAPDGPEERELLERFVTAFTELDVDRLISLMTDDVWVRMPPAPFEYRGRDAVHEFFTAIAAHRREIDRMLPIRANGQPGWGEYRRDHVTGVSRLTGVEVIALAGNRVCEITRFDCSVAAHFGLPRTLIV
jgi:RNA polymerase sigma-70 factor (ECF subfamily)